MTSAIPFLACALLAAAAPAPAAKPVRVPLASRAQYTPRANGEVDGPLLLTAINSTLHKYHAARALPTYPGVSDLGILKERAVASEALTDQIEQTEDELYYGPVTVGATTPQQFTADFDTGSSDFFVPGPQCGSGQGCVGTTKYDQGGTDEHNTTSVTYGSGMISGENYFDTVAVAGLSATHTNVISLTSAQGFDQSQSNSLLGMGFGSIAQSKQPTFFENLMSQGKVTNPEFAFYLGRGKSNTQSRSELTLGGTDTARYTGSLTRVPVTTKGFWQVALSSAVVSGKTAPATSGQAAIDTGTTVVLAPTVAATSIFAQIPGSFPVPLASGSPSETIFAYPCNTNKRVSLTFAGKQFVINPLDFNFGTLTASFTDLIGQTGLLSGVTNALGGGFCIGAVIGADIDASQNLYVVGDSFLKNWYSVYSYAGSASVSFAAAAGNQ